MNGDESAYKALSERLGALMQEYREALATNDTSSSIRLFGEAMAVWEELRGFDIAPGPKLEWDDFITMAFSHAVAARNPVEAKRVYEMMNEHLRSSVDAAEAQRPGLMKIWLKSVSP